MLVKVHRLWTIDWDICSFSLEVAITSSSLPFEGAVSGLLAAVTQIHETVNGTLIGRAMHSCWALLVFWYCSSGAQWD